jgi:hypothetical protein
MDAQPWRTCTIDPWNFDSSGVPQCENSQTYPHARDQAFSAKWRTLCKNFLPNVFVI